MGNSDSSSSSNDSVSFVNDISDNDGYTTSANISFSNTPSSNAQSNDVNFASTNDYNSYMTPDREKCHTTYDGEKCNSNDIFRATHVANNEDDKYGAYSNVIMGAQGGVRSNCRASNIQR